MKHFSWLLLGCFFSSLAFGQSRNKLSVSELGQLDRSGVWRYRSIGFGRSMVLPSPDRPNAFYRHAVGVERLLPLEIMRQITDRDDTYPGYQLSVSNRDKKQFRFTLTDTTAFCNFIGEDNTLLDSCFVQWTSFQSSSFKHAIFRRYAGFDYSYFGQNNFEFRRFKSQTQQFGQV